MNKKFKSTLSPVVYVESNIDISPSFKYGSLKLGESGNVKLQDDRVECIIEMVSDRSLIKEIDRYSTSRQKFSGYSFFDDIIVYQRKFLIFNLICIIEYKFNRIKIRFNKSYFNYSSLRFTQLPTIGNLASDFISLGLLDSGYATIHTAGVSNNDGGVLISGLPDTGKTYTTEKLTRECGYRLLSDDIVILDKKSNVYPVPYTLTYNKKSNFIDKLKKTFLRYDNDRLAITEVHKEVEYSKTCKLIKILFIENSNQDIIESRDNMYALNKIACHDKIEFTYFSNPFVRVFMYYKNVDISEYLNKYRDIVSGGISSAREITEVIRPVEKKPYYFEEVIK